MFLSEPPHNSNNHTSFPFEICNLLLGKGGSGQVFLGRRSGTNNYVAIKKRYAKPDSKKVQSLFSFATNAGSGQGLQIPLIQGTQNALHYAVSNRCISAFDTNSASCAEGSECEPLSQRREVDQGEESVTQMTALSQQGTTFSSHGATNDAEAAILQPCRLTDEVSILRYLGSHPQIVSFMGNYTSSNAISYFTMELMDSDVARELKEGNAAFSSETVCVAMAYSVLSALDYLHAHGVAHRDVKPGNILLKKVTDSEEWPCLRLQPCGSREYIVVGDSESGSATHPTMYVKAALGDFSAAHGVSSTDDSTFADTRGTLHYKAPEQLMGRRGTVSNNFAAVDMWGLGCTIYEMITGSRPFPGNSELQVLMSILDLMGSDIQSFPSVTRECRLFQNLAVSPLLLDLLQQLLTLDAASRPSAKETLQHPIFAALREAEAPFQRASNASANTQSPHLIGIPLTLKYAPVTHVPHLRFSRIARVARKAPHRPPGGSSFADAPHFNYISRQTTGDSDVAALTALTHYAQKRHASANNCESGDGERACSASRTREGSVVGVAAMEKRELSGDGSQHRSPDTTMMSLMSESSYLHWSEIRPMAPPGVVAVSQAHRPTPHLADNRDHSISERATGLFSSNTGNTPSSSINGAQRQLSESSRHPSASMYRNTVARALNISDSSIKVARTERSSSHVDFDLSPVAATQLFSPDADLSSCVVPHASVAGIPRPPLPVLQLKSGSTFTASNLRANSSFERDGTAAVAMTAATRGVSGNAAGNSNNNNNTFSTPREHALLRTTAYAGRALCFSEETDRFARGSVGSCPSQHSCLNSLLTSPAPLSRVHEGSSPHPSPIRPFGLAARSPSGVPLVERSGCSSDDSAVNLGWMGFDTGAASSTPADASVSAATAVVPPAVISTTAEDEEETTHVAAPVLTPARTESSISVCGGAAAAPLTLLCAVPPHMQRCLPQPPAVKDTAKLSLQPTASATGATARPSPTNARVEHDSFEDLETVSKVSRSRGSNTATGREATATATRVLPLPIPLSVAAGALTPTPSRELSTTSASSSSSPIPPSAVAAPRTAVATSTLLHETPHTQRFQSARSSSKRVAVVPTELRRSMSAIVAVTPSTSPEQTRRESSHTRVLQSCDINVAPSLEQRKQLLEYVTAPMYYAASSSVAAARSQRHCTPSSTDPSREESTARSCETRPLFASQVNSHALFAEAPTHRVVAESSTVHSLQTPRTSVVFSSPQTTATAILRRQSGCEGCSTATPHSAGRNSFKRSRENFTME